VARYRQREVAVEGEKGEGRGERGSRAAMRLAIAIAALCAAAAVVGAQDAQQPTPTFRSEASYVQLPVRVLDARGEFVSGLTQSDFQLLEDGRPQTITAFSAVSIPILPGDPAPDVPLAAVDPVASNDATQVDGRVYLFVLDNRAGSDSATLKVRQVVRGFISDRLSANDLAAVTMTGAGRGQTFTRNRRLLRDAVDRFISDPQPESGVHGVLNVIANTAEWMGSIQGRRKALVLVTPGQICALSDPECNEGLRHALRMAVQSDVSIYTVDPRGLVATQGAPAEESDRPAAFSPAITSGPLDGARYLADASGGFAIANTNNLSAGFERIVRENSSYYLLGYYSTNPIADGRMRKNGVTVARRGLQVVHRGGYVAPAVPTSAEPPVAASVDEQLRRLAASGLGLPVSAMPLRVAAAPFLSAGGTSRVAVVVEMPPEGLRPTDEDGRYRLNVGLAVVLADRDGKSVASDEPNIELSVPSAAGHKIMAQGVRLVSRIRVPPGTYQMWVGAVQTPSGLRGSVVTEIEVPDFDRHPLALSGIAVTTSAATRMYTARTDDLLDDVLGAPPVAHREFAVDSDLWIYGEIYDHRSGAGDVTASVTVTSTDGKLVYQTPFEPAPVQFGHLGRIPLTELGVGSYVATIEARSATPEPVSAMRTMAFRVK